MKKNNKLNVPATIVHVLDETQYRISCNIIGIDEAAETCTLEFRNGRVESGISLADVYINEKFIDTVRKYGKKFSEWIVSKVKGLMCILGPDGKEDANSFFTPVNIAVKQASGELPDAVKFFPSDNIIAQAEAAGLAVDAPSDDEILADEIMQEKSQIEGFWKKVMNKYGSSDSTLEESLDYVIKNDYKKVRFNQQINEAGIASFDPIANKLGWADLDGMSVNTEGLKSFITSNIDEQLNLSRMAMIDNINTASDADLDPDLADFVAQFSEAETQNIADGEYKTPVPLIWGAPGIGKTQIVAQCLKAYKKNPTTPRNMYLYTVSCAGLDADSFRLPDKASTDGNVEDATFEQGVLSWLPMYTPRTAEYNQMMEDRFARCQHISKGAGQEGLLDSKGDAYQGGVLFLDEVVRVNRNAIPVIMNICDRQLQEKRMAKSWAIVCAANRYSDDPTQEASAFLEATPIVQRFVHVTYKPERNEWLTWARSTNELGIQNIEPEICDFIEAMPEHIWYRLIDNGGYDEALKAMNPKLQANAADFYANGIDVENWEQLKDAAEEGKSPIALTKSTWNGRTWHRISNAYRNMLTFLLLQNPVKYTYAALVGRSIRDYDYHGVESNLLEEALGYVPDERWKMFVNQYIDPNERDAALGIDKDGHVNIPNPFKKLEWVRNALIRIVRLHSGAEEPDTAVRMKDYYDWQAMFAEKEVLNDIYKFGEIRISKYKETDNLGGSMVGGFNWKDNDAIVRQVEKFIISQYPGGTSQASKDFKDYCTYAASGLDQLRGTLATLATRSIKGDVAKKVEDLIANAFTLKHKFDEKEYKEMITVKTYNKQFGDIEIMPEVEPVIKTVLFNMVKECKFIANILNYAKYCIKIDFTRGNFAPIGYFKDSDNLKTYLLKNLSISQDALSGYSAVHNDVVEISSKNVGNNELIESTKYFDCFIMFKGLFTTAFNKKTITRMSGKVRV